MLGRPLAALLSLCAISCGSETTSFPGATTDGGVTSPGTRVPERVANLGYAQNLACDGVNLYLALRPTGGTPALHALALSAIDGSGNGSRVLTTMGQWTYAWQRGIETDGAFVYYTDQDDEHFRVPISGGAPQQLTSENVARGRVRVYGEHLYFQTGSNIVRMPKAGGAAEIIYDDTKSLGDPVFHNGFIYFTRSGDLLRAPVGPTLVVTVLASGLPSFDGISVNDRFVYLADPGDPGTLQRVPVTGGPVENIPIDFSPQGMTAGANGAWLTHGKDADGAIMFIGDDSRTPTLWVKRHGARDPIVCGGHLYYSSESVRVDRSPL